MSQLFLKTDGRHANVSVMGVICHLAVPSSLSSSELLIGSSLCCALSSHARSQLKTLAHRGLSTLLSELKIKKQKKISDVKTQSDHCCLCGSIHGGAVFGGHQWFPILRLLRPTRGHHPPSSRRGCTLPSVRWSLSICSPAVVCM